MFIESIFRKEISDRITLNSYSYLVKESRKNLETGKFANKLELTIKGLDNALHRAENIICNSLNRKLSIIEKKELYSNLYYKLPGWHLVIEKI